MIDNNDPAIPEQEKMDEPVCEGCSLGMDILEERQRQNMKEHGWYAHIVTDGDPDCPYGCNVHTHGVVQSFNHTDLQICAPIDPRIAHGLLTNIIDQIKEGKVFDPEVEFRGRDRRGALFNLLRQGPGK